MGQEELGIKVPPQLKSLAEEFLTADKEWRDSESGSEKGKAALEYANCLLRRATHDDLEEIARSHPWGLTRRQALSSLRTRQDFLTELHLRRAKERSSGQILIR